KRNSTWPPEWAKNSWRGVRPVFGIPSRPRKATSMAEQEHPKDPESSDNGGARIDPLAPLLELDGVSEAVTRVQKVVSEVHRHRANLHSGSATAAEASVRAARASAGLDGAGLDLPDETDGIVTDPL